MPRRQLGDLPFSSGGAGARGTWVATAPAPVWVPNRLPSPSPCSAQRKSDRDLATDRLQPAWADWPPAERQPAAGAADAPAPEAGARMAELSLARESQTPAQAFASAAAQLFAMVMGWGQPAPAPAPLSAPSVAEA